jgi:MoaA/NifB/PqqE/SkfB family radical SAM enzyme
MEIANLLSTAAKKIISPQSGLYRKLQLIWYRLYLEARKIKFKKLRFAVNLTDHCNLNCAYCDAFAPLAKENFYPLETFKRDCERLSQLTGGKISEIGFAGGEPLLHPDITGFFSIARSNFNKPGGGGG